MLRDGEVPEGRTETAVVQKVAHRVRYSTLESLQASYFVDSDHWHRQRTIRITNQNGGEYLHLIIKKLFEVAFQVPFTFKRVWNHVSMSFLSFFAGDRAM